MSHKFRFMAKKLDDSRWQLTEDEAYHALKVIRIKVGDLVEVADGKGSFGEGTVAPIEGKMVFVDVADATSYVEPDTRQLTLAIGALKHQELDDLIPHLSEVGLNRLCVFLHGNLEKSRVHEKSVERWKKIATNSAKQCKRAWVMEIETFHSLEAVAKKLGSAELKLVCDPAGEESVLGIALPEGDAGTAVLLGSEAGLNAKEVNYLTDQCGFQAVGMTKNILRSVTCALMAASILKLRQTETR